MLDKLNELYERLEADPSVDDAPPRGWSIEKVSWVLDIDDNGFIVYADPLTSGEGKNIRSFHEIVVPEHGGRTSGIKPFCLCDRSAYLLGYGDQKSKQRFEASKELHETVLGPCTSPAALAVLAFFSNSNRDSRIPEDIKELLAASSDFLVFRYKSDREYVHELVPVQEAWNSYYIATPQNADKTIAFGQCAVTGKQERLTRLFPQVTGVRGAQSSGASLVSFNNDSFESYGKKQSLNASIGEQAAFNAGSALKYLYRDPNHHIYFGDMALLFWTDRPAEKEEAIFHLFADTGFDGLLNDKTTKGAEDSAELAFIGGALEAMRKGHPVEGCDPSTTFYVAGIAPNAARLSLRLFNTFTFGELEHNINQYLDDISMINVKHRDLYSLLLQTASQGKPENLSKPLTEACFVAMIEGKPFPPILLNQLIMRMRADHAKDHPWDMGLRASLMKAYLVRHERVFNASPTDTQGRITMSLNQENDNPGYVLGRMFAVMDMAQQKAIPGTNTGIKDRYIGSASTTPALVFPNLFQGYAHHISKLKKQGGISVLLDKEMQRIADLLNSQEGLPKTLSVEDQGNFFIGYYQEMQHIYNRGLSSKDEPQEKTAGDDN